ncbi:MAG TPA: flagellar biosynthesis protein FlhB [Eubacterium sp.]|jgi:flagellar biosynthetic protein FlhB|nr:flagellar biosynthesis protein FlhB [Eubacterium sp.]
MDNETLLLKLNLQFFAKDGPGGEKTEPATSKKLNDIRKEGQVAKSKELITAVSLMSLFIILKIYLSKLGTGLIDVYTQVYNSISKVVDDSYNGLPIRTASSVMQQVIIDMIKLVIPILLVAIVIAILGNMLQQKWMVTAKPLQPKFSKISPISGFKRMFSVRQLVELIKSIAMISIIMIVVYNTVKSKMNILLTFYDVGLNTALSTIGSIIIDLGIKISAVFLIVGFADLFYQRIKFKNDNMMTKQEIKDEFKNTEGDPQVKGQIKRRMQEVSRRRMMQQLPEADVVITNPTHFAVALKYEPDAGKAPVVIAKGADYLAFQIKDKAKEYNIAIVENKPLARILYHNIDIGMEIPPELYQAVAEILAVVMRTNNRL